MDINTLLWEILCDVAQKVKICSPEENFEKFKKEFYKKYIKPYKNFVVNDDIKLYIEVLDEADNVIGKKEIEEYQHKATEQELPIIICNVTFKGNEANGKWCKLRYVAHIKSNLDEINLAEWDQDNGIKIPNNIWGIRSETTILPMILFLKDLGHWE